MDKSILVGTHHKTGTVWMYNVFSKFAKRVGIPFFDLSFSTSGPKKDFEMRDFINSKISKHGVCVFFEDHSRFPVFDKDNDCLRGIHMLRNPKHIIASSAYYHQWSKEEWLHVARKNFDNMTYHEKINSFQDIKDKLLFEMNHAAKENIFDMLKFDRQDLFIDIKFEELIKDIDLSVTFKIATHIGLLGMEKIIFQEEMYKNSLFGKQDPNIDHIKGKKDRVDYDELFEGETLEKFNEKFKHISDKYGY